MRHTTECGEDVAGMVELLRITLICHVVCVYYAVCQRRNDKMIVR